MRRLRSHAVSIVALLRGFRLPPGAARLLLVRALRQPVVVERRRDRMRFLVRSRFELLVLKEVALDHEYERFGEPLEDGWTLLDIGAGAGEFAVDAGLRLPSSTVHAVEPSPIAFDLLMRNLALNGLRNVIPHACAVTSANGTVAFDTSSPYTSLHGCVSSAGPGTARATRVVSRSLDALVRGLALERIDFLKVDCEGGELEVLGATSPDTLARIRRICVELHGGGGERDDEVAARLASAGFSVRRHPGPPWTATGWLYATRAAAG